MPNKGIDDVNRDQKVGISAAIVAVASVSGIIGAIASLVSKNSKLSSENKALNNQLNDNQQKVAEYNSKGGWHRARKKLDLKNNSVNINEKKEINNE